MIDFVPLLQLDQGQDALQIEQVTAAGFELWYKALPPRSRAAVDAASFKGKAGEHVRLPGDDALECSYAAGISETPDIWSLASLCAKLPAATYRLKGADPGDAALGWLLSHYRFDRYTSDDPVPQRILLTSSPAAIEGPIRLAESTALVRDLVNTPSCDLGPAEIASTVESIATEFGATIVQTRGDALETGYPLIHAVGMAADRKYAPLLIELEWGNPNHPRIAIIGKGVSFDSGGLDIKPSASMRLMKKDMGGAAHAIALARLVMTHRLPVRLHLLIPAAENAISGIAFRPGDILKSRSGLTVEIENTDAEGRLILADALTKAGEDGAQLIIDFATLTGAARVALGPDLPALFSNDDDLAWMLLVAGSKVDDPCWRLPIWDGYNDMLKSDIADTLNASESGFAGASTAALFLSKFVKERTSWAHFDTFAWRPSSKPGRPKGGEALGLRASFEALKQRFPVI